MAKTQKPLPTSPVKAAGPALSAQDREAAGRVLTLASQALAHLRDTLDGRFAQAIDAVLQTQGRVIVSGMGKSGHVARKIAATLASTGTPAQYVHPGEASHGDLGMVTRADCLLVLSNSGENQELGDIIAHGKRIAIPLIAITSKPASTLARAATILLPLPAAEEACPMGMAPTTSSTMMIALGDALAVALMERRGFTKDKYRELHPGGRLGQMLVRVADVMRPADRVPLVAPDTSVPDAVARITEAGVGCTGVADAQGRLIGVITDGDLRRHLGADLVTRTAQSIMTNTPRIISHDALAGEAIARMNDVSPPVMVLFVVPQEGAQPQVPVGILHMHDLLRAGFA
ncbi:KpsF/GutQ family sugar-phosphate isomerase [Pyruvatibacter sp.]|uniref:KpsF/GutQ family sugar-phosphate isomerase n=1 Tax=Pyruvatibacter sp. TaxID=1981328 RepID=UPI0032EB0721